MLIINSKEDLVHYLKTMEKRARSNLILRRSDKDFNEGAASVYRSLADDIEQSDILINIVPLNEQLAQKAQEIGYLLQE